METKDLNIQLFFINKIKPNWLLVTGILFMVMAHLSFNIQLMAWVSSVPFLFYLNLTKGFKARWLFVLALFIAWTFVTAKIITAPLPFFFIFLFSIPLALFHLIGYLLWDRYKKHPWSFLLFPAVMTVIEWLQYTFTPFASWGVTAYTQAQNITLMQSVSLFGMPGLSFLIYWGNISITEIAIKRRTTLSTFQLPLIIVGILILFGTFRYDISKSEGNNTMVVAAINTDSDVSGYPLPSKERNEKVKINLFQRTGLAAKSGAKLIVWTEGATYILPQEEPIWSDSLKALAAKLRVSLVAAYIIPVSEKPIKYENKYVLIDSSGAIKYTYHKHQPVPGEPAIKGNEPLQVFDIIGAKTGGAICYDYDFPYLAKEFGKLNADIIAVPASDWRGIDPLHTEMAAFRAVEQGHSIIRSTRFGLSAAITPYGEMVSQMSSFNTNSKIMIAHLPIKGFTTVYSIIGDSFIYFCMGFIAFFLYRQFFKPTT